MTLVSKKNHLDKLDGRVNKYHNTYHSTIKMEHSGVTHILTLAKKLIIKTLNLKLVILLEYQNIKMILQKVVLQIILKKCL